MQPRSLESSYYLAFTPYDVCTFLQMVLYLSRLNRSLSSEEAREVSSAREIVSLAL